MDRGSHPMTFTAETLRHAPALILSGTASMVILARVYRPFLAARLVTAVFALACLVASAYGPFALDEGS